MTAGTILQLYEAATSGLKILLALVASVAFGLFLVIAGTLTMFDIMVVQPRLPEVRRLISEIDIENRQPPQPLLNYAFSRRLSGWMPDGLGMRPLLLRLEGWESPNLRGVRSFGWSLLLPLHISREDRIAAELGIGIDCNGKGLAGASRFYFDTPMLQLDPVRQKCLAQFLRSPARARNECLPKKAETTCLR
jgi:hypothetical protein